MGGEDIMGGEDNFTLLVINTSLYSNGSVKSYYDPNKDECTLLARLVINTVIAGAVCFLGLAGNAFSYAVLRRDKQTPVASFLLQSLAITDSLFLFLWFLHFSINDIFEYARLDQYSYQYWMYVRLYSYPFLFIGQTATIWFTVLIALTRFVAICVPYRASQLCNLHQVRKYVGILSAFSVLYNLPRFFDTKIVHVVRKGSDKYYFSLATLGESALYRMAYLDIAYYLFSFVLPLLILAVLNTKLVVAYRRVQQRRRQLRGQSYNRSKQNKLLSSGGENNDDSHNNHKSSPSLPSSSSSNHSDPNITLVMIIVVLVFMLCNLPARVVQIVWTYRDQECLSPEFFIKEISNVLEVLNSSTNFIVYCVFRKKFRDILWRLLRCEPGAPSGGRETTCTMNTMVNGYTMVNRDPNEQDQDEVRHKNGNTSTTDV